MRPYDCVFMPVLLPNRPNTAPTVVPLCLNDEVKLEKGSYRRAFFDPGPHAAVEEPIFVPHSGSAIEAGGLGFNMVQRTDINRSDSVVLGIRRFRSLSLLHNCHSLCK